MGHKDLFVTHTLYWQRDYSEAHDAASAAPCGFVLVGQCPANSHWPRKANCRQQGNALIQHGLSPTKDGLVLKKALVLTRVAKFGPVGCTESPAYDR
jgi:hypothetical protein